MFNNFKNIDKVVYGRGSFDQLDHILSEQRHLNDGFMVFVVDNYFNGNQTFLDRIPVKEKDVIR
ncbi:MAG: 3-deoxy-alpha-D-manno-octulosonate 8-oxidase, partial [Dokdonia sp.]